MEKDHVSSSTARYRVLIMFTTPCSYYRRFQKAYNEIDSQKTKGSPSKRLTLGQYRKGYKLVSRFSENGGMNVNLIKQIFRNRMKECFRCKRVSREEHPLYISEAKSMEYVQKDLIAISKLSYKDVKKMNEAYRKLGIKDDFRDILIAQYLSIVLTSRMGMEDTSIKLPVKISGYYRMRDYKWASCHHLKKRT